MLHEPRSAPTAAAKTVALLPFFSEKVAPVSASLAIRNARFADAAGYPTWLTRTNAVALTAIAGTVANVAPASSATDARTTTDRTRTVVPDAIGTPSVQQPNTRPGV